jgi:hypothetical protein
MEPGQYMVTGDRSVTTVLTLFPPDADGDMRVELAKLMGSESKPSRVAGFAASVGWLGWSSLRLF